MSSLVKQLQQLQIPGTLQSIVASKTCKKASLLFEDKDAADIDNETLFSMGVNGLEELKVIEPAFSIFDNSLFGDTCKSLERTLQSKEVNEKLDKLICKFLQYLSPYFLLKPALKVLEWLIRRFQIHVFNADSLVSCILPYHETNLFARVVQLLSFKDYSWKWKWLRPIQKAGVPLPKTAFLQHCISDASLLSRVCDMAKEGLELEIPPSSFRVLFSFYTTTVVGVLDMMPAVTEKLLTHLLPNILRGLNSGVSELEASSYMITAQLCFKCNMEETLIKSLIESICKNLKPQLAVEGLSCLTYICQSQGIKKLSRRSFKALVQLPGLIKILHQLSCTHVITPLLDTFVPQLVSSGLKNAVKEETDPLLEIIQALLTDIEFEKDSVITIGRALLEEYCNVRGTLGVNEIVINRLNEKVKELMQSLEKRYPTELEKAIERHLSCLRTSEGTSEGSTCQQASIWTMNLVSVALVGMKSQVIPNSSTTLVLSLHHPQACVRQIAIDHLGDLLKGKAGLSEDKEFVSESLLLRLQDDDPVIVAGVLKLGQLLPNNLPEQQFVEGMLKLLKKESPEWDKVRGEALLLLVGEWANSADQSLVDRIVFELLPLCVLHCHSTTVALPLSLTISRSVLAAKHLLLSGLKDFTNKQEWKSCEDSCDFEELALANTLLLDWLGQNLMKMEDQQLLEMVHSMINHSQSLSDDNLFHLLLQCLLGRAVAMASGQCKMVLCKTATEYILPKLWNLARQQGDYRSYQAPMSKVLENEQNGKVPLSLLSLLVKMLGKNSTKRLNHAKGAITVWLCGILLRNIPAESETASRQWWFSKHSTCPEGIYTKLLVSLFEVIAFGSDTSTSHQVQFKELLKDLFQCHLADRLVLLRFLAHFWCRPPQKEEEGVPALLQVQCLHITNACLGSASGKLLKELFKTTCTVVPSLLVPISSPISVVRKLAISCTKTLAQFSPAQASPFTSLIMSLVDNGEELAADSKYLPRVLGDCFAPLKSHGTSQSKASAEIKCIKNTLNYIMQLVITSETPSYIRRILLSSLRKVVTQDMMEKLLPVMEQLLDKCKAGMLVLDEDESNLLQLIIQKYTFETANLLQVESLHWKTLLRVLLLRTSVCPGHPPPVVTLLGQFSRRFFKAIPTEELKQQLFKILLDILHESKDVVVGNAVKSTILKFCLTADMVSEELLMLDPKKENKPKKKKVKRTQQEHKENDNEISHHLQRVTAILELLQVKINVEEPHQLFPGLFTTLKSCVELDHSQAASEYIMQLVFSLINNICHKISLDSSSAPLDLVPEDQFDVELIVQCIRSSERPQTHNQALLLLATAAELFPEKVLQNVMSIFTFMGASVVCQDDSYSFEVITKTVDTVIPALIQAGEKQQLPQLTTKGSISLKDIVAMLMRVFVDALPHIPEHRQLPLFTHLVSTVGSIQFLHTAVLLLLEKHVLQGANTSDDEKQAGVRNHFAVEFCLSLCHSFESNVQVEAILKLLQYIDELPLEKPEAPYKPNLSHKAATSFLAVRPLFDVNNHSAKHLRHFKYTSLSIIPSILDSEDFVNKVYGEGEILNLLFLRLLEKTLNFLTKTAQHSDQASNGSTGKFWKALLHKAYEIIDKVNMLLPTSVFFEMIRKLLHSSIGTVRHKAMDLLNSNLGHHTNTCPHDQQVEALLGLVKDLLTISKGTKDMEETIINQQTALYSLKLLSPLLAKDHPSLFKEVMCAAINVCTYKDANAQVVSSALLCIAEVVSGLKAHAIPFLPQLVPSVLKLIRRNEENSLLALCGVTALYKTTEALPHFLSPYLVDILIQVASPLLARGNVTRSKEEKTGDTKHSSVDSQLHDCLISLRKVLAGNISPRIFISAVTDCYHKVVDNQRECVAVLMSMVADCVSNMTKDDIKTYQSNLFNLFLEALDFRVHHNQEEDDKTVDETEDSVIEAFLYLVIKLSEASFRPMFLRLLDWATASSHKERLLVFYHLCDSVAEKLKGLFVLFAGYIVKNCASLLDTSNIAKTEESIFPDTAEDRSIHQTCLLLNYLLDCLNKCFMYDTHGFLNSDHFHCLVQPLVDQIENLLGGEAEFKERLSTHLAPCLAQFAVAAGNYTQWKPLNYQVLLKTRNSSAMVRFAALKVLEGFHAQLGEDFLVLLPETIPFLAELMEDECFEVEQQCQHVILAIEQVLGEPLQKYF